MTTVLEARPEEYPLLRDWQEEYTVAYNLTERHCTRTPWHMATIRRWPALISGYCKYVTDLYNLYDLT